MLFLARPHTHGPGDIAEDGLCMRVVAGVLHFLYDSLTFDYLFLARPQPPTPFYLKGREKDGKGGVSSPIF